MSNEATGATGGAGATGATGSMVGAQTGRESSLSNWVGPYVTELLGRGQALGSQPYQAYTGPLTAGASPLQQQAFQGIAGLTIPTEQMQAFTPQTFGAEQAQAYMNPYLTAALNPQIEEARRQAEIQRMGEAGRLARAGAYGGTRQAVMESEGSRNLLSNLANITGTGYASAYDKAMQQFNKEQEMRQGATKAAQEYGLGVLGKQLEYGGQQRGIESEGIAADIKQFEQERDYPYRQVGFMQSLLQNLPTGAQSFSYQEPSALSRARTTAGGIQELWDILFGGAPAPAPAPR